MTRVYNRIHRPPPQKWGRKITTLLLARHQAILDVEAAAQGVTTYALLQDELTKLATRIDARNRRAILLARLDPALTPVEDANTGTTTAF